VTAQLTSEIEWLRRLTFTPAPPFTPVPLPASWHRIADGVEGLLRQAQLAPMLSILEQHNSRLRREPGRRTLSKIPFLLGPLLFQVLLSVESRRETRTFWKALDRPAVSVREHFQEASAKCKSLAQLLRQAPHPHVVLAPPGANYDVFSHFMPIKVIQAPTDQQHLVSLAWVLDNAATALAEMARNVRRSKENRSPKMSASETNATALRLRTVEVLVPAFREKLGHPYHAHVATIATVISCKETDADFVKKAEGRRKPDRERATAS
jgi:hypothetical protein